MQWAFDVQLSLLTLSINEESRVQALTIIIPAFTCTGSLNDACFPLQWKKTLQKVADCHLALNCKLRHSWILRSGCRMSRKTNTLRQWPVHGTVEPTWHTTRSCRQICFLAWSRGQHQPYMAPVPQVPPVIQDLGCICTSYALWIRRWQHWEGWQLINYA